MDKQNISSCSGPFTRGLQLFCWVLLSLLSPRLVWAQAPTTLRYPTPVVYEAQVDSVYLAPTVSGLVAAYSISPGLPAGLSFNTNTGVVSGRPADSSAATTYTVTATNSDGSTTGTFSLRIIKTFYSAGISDSIKFLNTNAVVKVNNTPLSDTARYRKGGQRAGDIVLYQNVITLNGTAIDCIVKTMRVTRVGDWRAYDMDSTGAAGFANNHPAFFSPMINFLNGGGSVLFNFQFILGGSYNDVTHSGTNITLQNIRLNTYDLDGNNSTNSKQYNSFKSFSSAELGNPTLIATSFDTNTGRTRFESTTDSNILNILDPRTRVRLSYQNASNFDVEVGSITNGAAYFFLDFSSGQSFNTAVNTSAPSVDLNTALPGNVNERSGCGTPLMFTAAGQSNITATGNLNGLEVRFPAADIKDGAGEQLAFNGAATPLPLNAPSIAATITIGGVSYDVTGTTDTTAARRLSFTKSGGGVLTVAEAEAVLDALQYQNTAAVPTAGERHFTVNVFNNTYRSPDALFSATLTCVTLSGHIYRDANALTDGKVNATGTPFAAGSLYAVLTRTSDNTVVLPPQPITAGGSFSFGTATEGVYSLYFVPQSAVPAVGAVVTASILPAAPAGTGVFVFTGEHLSADAGNDGLADGKLTVTLGSRGVANANFGLEQIPTTAGNTLTTVNPQGYNFYTLPGGSFPAADADGTVDSIVVTAFPVGANYLKIDSVVYVNPSGGVCPPLFACTSWPGAVRIPVSGGNPSVPVAIDPSGTGSVSVLIPFYAVDNGHKYSAGNSTLAIQFNVPATPLSVWGNVWNDANGNGLQESGEASTQAAGPGQTLYAVLVQNDKTYAGVPVVFDAAPVAGGAPGYTFTNVPAGNNYEVRLYSLAAAPAPGSALSALTPQLAPGWTGVSLRRGATVVAQRQHTQNLILALNNLSASVPDASFGIEQVPTSNNVNYAPAGWQPVIDTVIALDGSPFPALSGNDPEDGLLDATTTNRTVRIDTLPANGTLFYNGNTIVAGQLISGFNPSLLTLKFTGSGYTTTQFAYAYVDSAGVPSAAATYRLSWSAPLPVTLLSFHALASDNGVWLRWRTGSEANNKGFRVEHSTDARHWNAVGFVGSHTEGGSSGASYEYYHALPGSGLHYYRLYQEDHSGVGSYSPVRSVRLSGPPAALEIYPNPADREVTVTGTDIVSLLLLDIRGVRQAVPFYPHTSSSWKIAVDALPEGVYFLTVFRKNGVENHRMLIAR